MEAVVNLAYDYDPDGVDVHFLKNSVTLENVKNGKEILDELGEIKKTFKQSITVGPAVMYANSRTRYWPSNLSVQAFPWRTIIATPRCQNPPR